MKNYFFRFFLQTAFFFLAACPSSVLAQSFEVRDVAQFFVPSLILNTELQFPRTIKQDTASFFNFSAGAKATVPLSGKIDLDLNLDKLKNWKNVKSWKDVGNIVKSIPLDVSGYQTFLNFAGGYRSTVFDYDSTAHHGAYFSLGMSGLHLQKKFRVFFWGASLGLSEEFSTLGQFSPQINLYGGQARVSKYGFLWYYGGFVHYSNKRIIPVPFAGITAALPPFFSLQVTLPFQAKITYQKKKKLRASFEVALTSFQTGFENRRSGWLPVPASDTISNEDPKTLRVQLASSNIKVATIAEHHTDAGKLSIEVGTVFARSANFYDGNDKISSLNPKAGPYIALNYRINLQQKSLIKGIWDKLNFKW